MIGGVHAFKTLAATLPKTPRTRSGRSWRQAKSIAALRAKAMRSRF